MTKKSEFSIQKLTFMPGLELNRRYFFEIIQPLLKKYEPGLHYSAALMGYGSDVLGFDNATSMDHNWGPRGQIFVAGHDASRVEELRQYLAEHLPGEFLGFPTHFTDKRSDFTQSMTPYASGKVNHLIDIIDLDHYFADALHSTPMQMTAMDWLRVPEQKMLELTSGEVFCDGLERLNDLRSLLHYYPREVRLLKLAAYWNCISNEEAFIGRAVELNDLLGLKLIAARQVNTLLKLCFAIRQRYVPYSKWFTHGFDMLDLSEVKQSGLEVLRENKPREIERLTAEMYRQILDVQNTCADLPKIQAEITTYYNRPYRVIMAEHISRALIHEIADERLRDLDLNEIGLDNRIDGLDLTNHNTLEKIFSKGDF
jgi:hypothetical protein